jgi:hypothetical protein
MYSREHLYKSSSEGLPAYIEKLHVEARDILENAAIKPMDFAGLYGVQNVAADIEYVETMKEQFAVHETPDKVVSKKMATIFEGLIHVYSSKGKWFGPHSTMQKASEYDDIKNGVDSFVEFQPPQQPTSQLALAIDVTFAQHLQKKFDRIREEIEKGELTEIKYFVSKKANFEGRKTKVPRVVIGANVAIVKSLADLWVEGREDILANHPIQNLILQEAMMQCERFAHHAEKAGRQEIADIYRHNLILLKNIFASKPNRGLDLAEDDKVFRAIKEHVARL